MSHHVHPAGPRINFRWVVLPVLFALLGADRPTTGPDAAPEAATELGGLRPIAGIAINAHHIGNLSLYHRSVDRIADLGANAVIIVTPMYQERVDSTEIRLVPEKCPTRAQVVSIIERARRRGLRTMLLPIVLIEHPEDKQWRGTIRPNDWDAWWRSYDACIDYFLGIAVETGVDLFSVGSELNTTEEQVARWEHVVTRVRERFDGLLTYSANWDRYRKVQFWQLVDVMSVSSYFELVRDDPAASEDRLVEAWAGERDRLLGFAGRSGRPLLLSEVGYPSLPWASAHPWNYVAGTDDTADHEAQARCYRAFFRAWGDVVAEPDGTAAGFFLYRWDPYHRGGPNDTGYGIEGKPAKEVVREGLARLRRAADRR